MNPFNIFINSDSFLKVMDDLIYPGVGLSVTTKESEYAVLVYLNKPRDQYEETFPEEVIFRGQSIPLAYEVLAESAPPSLS